MDAISKVTKFADADNLWLDLVNEKFGDDAFDALQDERGEGEVGSPIRAAFDARQAALKLL